MQNLTAIQKEILDFIEGEIAETGGAPTLRNIGRAFRFKAIGTVQGHVRALIDKGYLEKDPGKARGLRLPAHRWAGANQVPILGQIAAGSPREAVEIMLGAVPLPSHLANRGDCFALRVTGDSMIDAGIHEGDLVIARQQREARNGDIVVALIGGDATVKRLEKKGKVFRLLPENSNHSPIPIQSTEDVIQGKVIAVYRFLEE